MSSFCVQMMNGQAPLLKMAGKDAMTGALVAGFFPPAGAVFAGAALTETTSAGVEQQLFNIFCKN